METYVIPVKGLSLGSHSYKWTVGRELFATYTTSEISDADLLVEVVVMKHPHFVEVNLSLSGWAEVECDRCLDPVCLDIDANAALYVRFDGRTDDSDDNEHDVVLLAPDETEFDLTHYLYETAHLALPLKRVHREDQCNRQMMEQYARYVINRDEDDVDIDN